MMRYEEIKGDPIDLKKYPKNTDLIILCLYNNSQNRVINKTTTSGLSLKEISDETSLTKSKVRTRVKKLVANNHLDEKVPYPDRTRPKKYYSLKKRAKITAWALELGEEVLGGVPENPNRQDIIDLLGRTAKNEKRIHKIKKRLGNVQANLDEW